jgi:hypothetical protein
VADDERLIVHECTRCNLATPWPSGFVRDANKRSGYRRICLACHRIESRKRRMENGEEEKEIAAALAREEIRVAAANEAMAAKLVPIEWPVLRRSAA